MGSLYYQSGTNASVSAQSRRLPQNSHAWTETNSDPQIITPGHHVPYEYEYPGLTPKEAQTGASAQYESRRHLAQRLDLRHNRQNAPPPPPQLRDHHLHHHHPVSPFNNSDFGSASQRGNMSLSYEPRNFPVEYPQPVMHDPHQGQDDMHNQYPSPPPPHSLSDHPYNTHPQELDPAASLQIEDLPELPHSKDDSDAPSPGRSKPIPKPDREVTKGDDGRFVCKWPGCTEETRVFNRKCEWSKVRRMRSVYLRSLLTLHLAHG